MSEADLGEVTVAARDGKPARRLAVAVRPARGEGAARPGVVWLGGFRSDMESGKALALDGWAARTGRGFARFDYSGHGRSEGRFDDGTIGQWLDDAVAVILARTAGPQILVGSSMGAWIALLAIRLLASAGEGDRVAGSVLIAPAVDFTERLMWARMPEAARQQLLRDGLWLRPSAHGDPYPITRALIEDGREHLLLDGVIEPLGPVHILQGMRDEDVPWQHAMTLVEHLGSEAVSLTLVRDGEHRLSRAEDLAKLIAAVENLV